MVTTLSTWVQIAEGAVTIFALLVGAYVALGWREKELATSGRDLAKRILVAVYKVRNAIQDARLPYRYVEDADTAAGKKDIQAKQDELLAKVEAPIAALDVELLEAEAVWGEGLKQLCRKIKAMHLQLQALSYLFYTMDGDDPNEKEQYVAKLFRPSDPSTEDVFAKKLSELVTQIENILRPKLRLRERESMLRRAKSLWSAVVTAWGRAKSRLGRMKSERN